MISQYFSIMKYPDAGVRLITIRNCEWTNTPLAAGMSLKIAYGSKKDSLMSADRPQSFRKIEVAQKGNWGLVGKAHV